MQVEVQWRDDEGVCDIVFRGARIEDDTGFQSWHDAFTGGLADVRRRLGGRFPIVMRCDGLSVEQRLAERYRSAVARTLAEYASCSARYGEEPRLRAVMAVAAVRTAIEDTSGELDAGQTDGLFPDRRAAVEYVLARVPRAASASNDAARLEAERTG